MTEKPITALEQIVLNLKEQMEEIKKLKPSAHRDLSVKQLKTSITHLESIK